MLYEKAFKTFEEHQLAYVIIGGIAVNLHGYSRVTGDLDIVISLKEEETQKFVRCCKALGLLPRVPVAIEDFANASKRESWIRDKNMKVFSVYNPKNMMEHIDVMTENFIAFETLYKNRIVLSEGNIHLSVAGITDIIKLKKISGRERDKIDIAALEKILEFKNEPK